MKCAMERDVPVCGVHLIKCKVESCKLFKIVIMSCGGARGGCNAPSSVVQVFVYLMYRI